MGVAVTEHEALRWAEKFAEEHDCALAMERDGGEWNVRLVWQDQWVTHRGPRLVDALVALRATLDPAPACCERCGR